MMHLLFAAMGFVAAAAQILIMRRFVVIFGGNELVTGGVFAGWLGFSCLGSIISSRLSARIRDADRAAATCLLALALSIPATIVISYLAKPAMGIPAPVMVGPWTALAMSAALMSFTGLLIGAGFTFCAMLAGECSESSVPRVYLMDALGAGLGGLIVSLVAIKHFTALQAAFIVASLMTAAVGVCFARLRIKLVSLFCIVAFAAAMSMARPMQVALTEILWKGFNPVVEVETPISSLMVTDNMAERTLFVNGAPSFSLPLGYMYEAISNLPLIEHKGPKDVVMIEGGLSGTMAQWVKWRLANAYFLRLDPEISYLEATAMPSGLARIPPWLMLHHGDGLKFIKMGEFGGCRGKCLDVITINVGNPDTAAADRYFTREFFEKARAVLKEDGVLCVWMLEPANAMGEETAELLGSVMATLRQVFPRVVMLPLDRFYFFATEDGAITDRIDELISRLKERGIDSPYLSDNLLAGTSQERVDSFSDAVEAASAGAAINTDARPLAFFNGMILWEKRFGSGRMWFAGFGRAVKPWMGAALLASLLIASLFFNRRTGAKVGAVWALVAVGFASMSYEIALLVHCQMVMGVMLWRLGFIITAFMAGAGIGAWAGIALKRRGAANRSALLAALAAIAVFCLGIFVASSVSFVGANLVMGLLCGVAYQSAAVMVFADKGSAAFTAGVVQASDLAGAVAGSLLTGLIVIPLFGIVVAAMAAAALCAAAFILVILER